MRHWHLSTLLVIALFCLSARADERILNYDSDIKVLPNAVVQVHETIQVRSELNMYLRHGISRDFPTRYTGRNGQLHVVHFEVVEVRRDGQPEPYTTEEVDGGIHVTIGSGSKELDPGEHTYELTYTATRKIGYFADHDELYWNVTGHGWKFPIDRASATVTLPFEVPAGELRLTAYTGPAGSGEQYATFKRVDASTASFATTQPLQEGEGLTIVVGFPKGVVAEPSADERFHSFINDNAHWLVGLLGLAVVLVYYYVTWRAVGVDPRPAATVVRYEPPLGLSPPAMRYLYHREYDDKVLVTAVVDLAVKRYITLERNRGGYWLKRLKPADDTLPDEEKNLLGNLFTAKNEIAITTDETTTLFNARNTLKDDVEAAGDETWFSRNRDRLWPGICLTLVTFVLMLLCLPQDLHLWPAIPLIFLTLSAVMGLAMQKRLIPGPSRWRLRELDAPTGVFFFLAALLGSMLPLMGFFGLIALVDIRFALVVLALLAANVAFFYLMPALTPTGRELLDEVEGFRQYLMEVDSDRLQRMDAPARTPSIFEKCLPYALALGVEQPWARQFELGFVQAARVDSTTESPYSPEWLAGADGSSFSPSHFAGSISDDFSSAITSATSAPGSGSGFDGGSSGGGGGG